MSHITDKCMLTLGQGESTPQILHHCPFHGLSDVHREVAAKAKRISANQSLLGRAEKIVVDCIHRVAGSVIGFQAYNGPIV